MTQPRLWAVVGATGTGKSSLSLDLAARLAKAGRGVEIVNADAMQVYRGMDIGTAKLSLTERQDIEHHLLDVLSVTQEATVAWYQATARQTISQIHSRGNDAILVGGSGLYVSSVIFDFKFPPRDEALRSELEFTLETSGVTPLIEHLRALQPDVADAVDVQNPRRVVRALEVALLGGDAQVTLPSEPRLWFEQTQILGVRLARQSLVDRLDARVSEMWARGMVEEVRSLLPQGIEQGKTASQAIGYAQALGQLRGEKSEQAAILETQQLTRRYARRQVSWFKRYPSVVWLDTASAATVSLDQPHTTAPTATGSRLGE